MIKSQCLFFKPAAIIDNIDSSKTVNINITSSYLNYYNKNLILHVLGRSPPYRGLIPKPRIPAFLPIKNYTKKPGCYDKS